ncbi:hypothetical protein [Crateriforma conspicua]|uniref:hypothetical protein n=1 Tax=Crateriforma conspicua TaxID=2527996 RepID=UPI0018CD664F|nr:hypothetical protein [Crateriforma conspicua]
MQYSTATLLTITLLFAIALALSRFDSLLIPIVFPFTLGPIVAYRVTPSRTALLIGTMSSVFWSLVSIVPFGIVAYLLIWPVAAVDERLLTRGLIVTSAILYFLAASVLGGYIGGIVARRD